MTWLAIRTFVSGIPRWVWIAVALGIAALLFGIWLADRERKAVEADRNASKAEAVSKARDADESAGRASTGKMEGIRDGNERARAAAAGSDDPLGDGLRSLRTETDRNR